MTRTNLFLVDVCKDFFLFDLVLISCLLLALSKLSLLGLNLALPLIQLEAFFLEHTASLS